MPGKQAFDSLCGSQRIAGTQLQQDTTVLAKADNNGLLIWWRDQSVVASDLTLEAPGFDRRTIASQTVNNQAGPSLIGCSVMAKMKAAGSVDHLSLVENKLVALAGRWVQASKTVKKSVRRYW